MVGKSRIGNTRNRKWFLNKFDREYNTPELEDTWKILKDNRSFNRLIGVQDRAALREIVNICQQKRAAGEHPIDIVRALQREGRL